MKRQHSFENRLREQQEPRRGAFMILAVSCLVVTIGFVAFSVDVGMISLTRSQMQSAVDAAALAAAMEITHAVQTAPPGEQNVTVYARSEAAAKAAEVAQLNGFYVDPNSDVQFGARTYDEASGQFTIDWGIGASDPANAVKVTARRENSDLAQPDAKLRLFFAGIFGDNTASLRTAATAYVEARDLVVVHDFSRSMNFDSYYADEANATLTDADIEANLQTVYNDLQPLNLGSMTFAPQWLVQTHSNPNISVTFKYSAVDVTSAETLKKVKLKFTDGNEQTINTSGTTGSYAGSGSNNGKNVSNVWVTVTVPSQEPEAASVSQSGSPTIYATFSGDRKSVSVSASSKWNRVQMEFTDGSTQTIDDEDKSETYYGTGGYSGKKIKRFRVRYGSTWRNWINAPSVTYQTVYTDSTYQFDDTDSNVKAYFGLNGVSYPFPYGSWDEYIYVTRYSNKMKDKGYAEKYGGLTFVNYILRYRSSHAETPAIANTKHYPFHAIKLGHALLCDFLEDLGFNDHLGMVSYDTYHRVEKTQNEVGLPVVDLTANPLSTSYDAIKNLMSSKQANHYYPATNIGGGMRDAVSLLDAEKRMGARPNILLMTDGNANTTDGLTTLPSGWQSWFNGFNGPGTTYSVSHDNASSSIQTARLSLLHEVHDAVSKGYTIHTIAVGADADWKTMKAIAHYSGGEFIYVPGGQSVAQMETDMMAAFHKIAGLVPPAKLLAP